MSGPFLASDRAPSRLRAALARLRPRRFRRIRPTAEGGIFFATALAVAGAALNTGNNLLYLVFALMLSLIALSGVLSEVAIQRVLVERRLTGRVFAGRPAVGVWRARNPRRRLPNLGLRLSELPTRRAAVEGTAAAYVPWVSPGESAERAGTWRFTRRGRHRLEGVRVSTTWPFGILRKWYDIAAPLDVVVLPAPGAAAEPVAAPSSGAERRARAGRGAGDFLGLREHREGEGLREVHWRSTARLRRRMVAERAADARSRLVVRVAPRGDDDASFEVALCEAVGTVLAAEASDAELDLEVSGRPARRIRTAAERDALLRRLAVLRRGEQP